MANKNKIFNSFVYNVLLHGYSKDEIYQPTNFDLWFCYKNQNFENNKDLRLRNISNIFCDSNNNKGDNFNMNKISAVYQILASLVLKMYQKKMIYQLQHHIKKC